MTSRVFIPQYPMHWRRNGHPPGRLVDLTPAQDYGEITVLLPGKPELVPAKVLPLLHEGLKTFDPKKDYIVPVGHPVLIMWTALVLGRYTNEAQFLDWDRHNQFYNVVPLTITEGIEKCLTPNQMTG